MRTKQRLAVLPGQSTSSPMNSKMSRQRPLHFLPDEGQCCPIRRCSKLRRIALSKEFYQRPEDRDGPFAPVHSATQLAEAIKAVGLPAVLKTRQLGYDGKGQAKITKGGDAIAAWRSLKNAPSILEGFIDFEREVSVVAARGRDGKVECFEVTENEHRDHILKISRVPAK